MLPFWRLRFRLFGTLTTRLGGGSCTTKDWLGRCWLAGGWVWPALFKGVIWKFQNLLTLLLTTSRLAIVSHNGNNHSTSLLSTTYPESNTPSKALNGRSIYTRIAPCKMHLNRWFQVTLMVITKRKNVTGFFPADLNSEATILIIGMTDTPLFKCAFLSFQR